MKVIVIGGGVIGLATAWRLAKGGASVQLFESRACGEGATLASLGALWPASPLSQGPLQELHRESLWQFATFAAEAAGDSGLPISVERHGRLEFLHSKKAVSRAVEEAAHANEHWPKFDGHRLTMEVLGASEIAEWEPQIAAPSDAALLCRATGQVNVRELVAGLRGACLKRGVALHEHTLAVDLEHDGTRISALCAAGPGATAIDRHIADAFLVAAGAWTSLLPLNPPVELEGASLIGPARGQGISLAPPRGVALKSIMKSGPVYLVPWQDEILVGSTTEREAGYDERPTDAAREFLFGAAAALVPALAGAKILRHWAGLRPLNSAKPHAPIMGPHPRFANLYISAGHYKTGIGMSPVASALVSQAILEQKIPAGLAPFLPREKAPAVDG